MEVMKWFGLPAQWQLAPPLMWTGELHNTWPASPNKKKRQFHHPTWPASAVGVQDFPWWSFSFAGRMIDTSFHLIGWSGCPHSSIDISHVYPYVTMTSSKSFQTSTFSTGQLPMRPIQPIESDRITDREPPDWSTRGERRRYFNWTSRM